MINAPRHVGRVSPRGAPLLELFFFARTRQFFLPLLAQNEEWAGGRRAKPQFAKPSSHERAGARIFHRRLCSQARPRYN